MPTPIATLFNLSKYDPDPPDGETVGLAQDVLLVMRLARRLASFNKWGTAFPLPIGQASEVTGLSKGRVKRIIATLEGAGVLQLVRARLPGEPKASTYKYLRTPLPHGAKL